MKINRKFRKLSLEARIKAILDAGYINQQDAQGWLDQAQCLSTATAEKMVENVIGTFSLPEGVAINFPLNGRDYLVPMVVEEPSVIAALSYAGLMAEKSGGFQATYTGTIISGQIQLVDIDDSAAVISKINDQKSRVLAAANGFMENMVKRGGGAVSLDCYALVGPNTAKNMVVVKINIDTQDAMGANLVNSVCEGIAAELEAITGARALLKILSNLADQAIARAEVVFAPQQLSVKDKSGEQVRDDIVLANDFALADPYRATTHNKGIMNGIDPLALATGNDWRSVEAAAHAYAARDGQYRALTQWTVTEGGDLRGVIELPIKVGIIGASLQTNPAVAYNQRLLGIDTAAELAQLMAAVGLAQNFAALRALASSGIQRGHMTLHARSVALTAGIPEEFFDEIVRLLVADGEIKVWKAQAFLEKLKTKSGDSFD